MKNLTDDGCFILSQLLSLYSNGPLRDWLITRHFFLENINNRHTSILCTSRLLARMSMKRAFGVLYNLACDDSLKNLCICSPCCLLAQGFNNFLLLKGQSFVGLLRLFF